MQGKGVFRWQGRKCAIQGQWWLLLLLWLSTIESVNKVEVRSHQRGREWRCWEEGCICALRSPRNSRDLVSIKALSADLMGINADGMCSTGRKSWWIEREQGNEKKKKGEERRRKRKTEEREREWTSLFVNQVNILQGGANEGVTERLEVISPIASSWDVQKKSHLPSLEIGSKYPQGSSPSPQPS